MMRRVTDLFATVKTPFDLRGDRMKRIVLLILCMALLLGGCTWMDGEYHSVKPHAADYNKLSDDVVTVSDYIQLRDALLDMVR